jgi:hypothetical protein
MGKVFMGKCFRGNMRGFAKKECVGDEIGGKFEGGAIEVSQVGSGLWESSQVGPI